MGAHEDDQLYRAIGRIEGGVEAIHKRLDAHAADRVALELKLDAHVTDIEAHGIKTVKQVGATILGLGSMAFAAFKFVVYLKH